MPSQSRRKIVLAGLVVVLLSSVHAFAQDPNNLPIVVPEWEVDFHTNSMVLTPASANLALGLPTAKTTLQIMGSNVTASPATGYAILGTTDMLHMQMDRNDIRVAGSTSSTVGALYLQRYGGSVVFHGSQSLSSRLYVTMGGDVGIATSDPHEFAVDREFISPSANKPRGALAVDGHIYSDRVSSLEVSVLDKVRIGRRLQSSSAGATLDQLHVDALLQVGGKISAQQIAVHVDKWADDVFEDDCQLMPVDELEVFVKRERHLPGVPSEKEVKATGIDLVDSQAMLLRKIEELTLYTIEQQKRIEELERTVNARAK
jgi:hypothetical protein